MKVSPSQLCSQNFSSSCFLTLTILIEVREKSQNDFNLHFHDS